MDKVISMIGQKAGDVVEDALKGALGLDDKDEDKEKDGVFSFFGGGKKKEEEEKGGLFSFGNDKKKEEEKGGFFSNMFDKDDEKEKDKKSGFHGLFSEQGAAGGPTEGEGGESGGQSVGVSDGDLFSDLMDVAEETSKGQ